MVALCVITRDIKHSQSWEIIISKYYSSANRTKSSSAGAKYAAMLQMNREKVALILLDQNKMGQLLC